MKVFQISQISATTADRATAAFGEGVDLYVDVGEPPKISSTVTLPRKNPPI